jgi:type I restriction enzyme R subunit
MAERSGQRDVLPFHLFDAEADVQIVERRLPHWSQAGAICFITFRTHDSLPSDVLDRWFADRARWLAAHGIRVDDPHWRQQLDKLGLQPVREFLDTFWNRWHDALDAGEGECVLRRPELSRIVADSLEHFDGQRYELLDHVVMPNHVHLLAAFPNHDAMLEQCDSWKHYTALQINRRLGRGGRFWQTDGFDHLVRSEPQFEYLRQYIRENPFRAGLHEGEFVHYSKPLP